MTYWFRILAFTLPAVLAAGCGGGNSASSVESSGGPATTRTRFLEGGTAVLQSMQPVAALNVYVDGFHFLNGDLRAQSEAHHYCSVLNEDVKQCVLFDGNGPDARLTGVEYIVSRQLFETLPREEKVLWHSHAYEVKSGQLIAPGVPETAEHAFMDEMVDTYGKTWHTWHTDQNFALPIGHPALMMGFTEDGQANATMIAARDRRFDIATAEKRRSRKDIDRPRIIAGADAWRQGQVMQLMLHPRAIPQMKELYDADEVLTWYDRSEDVFAQFSEARARD